MPCNKEAGKWGVGSGYTSHMIFAKSVKIIKHACVAVHVVRFKNSCSKCPIQSSYELCDILTVAMLKVIYHLSQLKMLLHYICFCWSKHGGSKEVTFGCTRMKPSRRTRAPDSDAIWLCGCFYWWALDRGRLEQSLMERDEVALHSRGYSHRILQPGYFGPERHFITVHKYFPSFCQSLWITKSSYQLVLDNLLDMAFHCQGYTRCILNDCWSQSCYQLILRSIGAKPSRGTAKVQILKNSLISFYSSNFTKQKT